MIPILFLLIFVFIFNDRAEGEALFYVVIYAVIGVLTSFLYFGVAQVINFVGRTSHSMERLCLILDTKVLNRLDSIERRLSPITPLSVKIVSNQNNPNYKNQEAVYHYHLNDIEHGPFNHAELLKLYTAGVLSPETPVISSADIEWRKYKDYSELK